ncbi:MAG: hypothetical protein M1814_005832 [Vezdaea aestivalis]|nr:MAG: hypothetical protein M1814_005832 [Vezdaea aestivalis]
MSSSSGDALPTPNSADGYPSASNDQLPSLGAQLDRLLLNKNGGPHAHHVPLSIYNSQYGAASNAHLGLNSVLQGGATYNSVGNDQGSSSPFPTYGRDTYPVLSLNGLAPSIKSASDHDGSRDSVVAASSNASGRSDGGLGVFSSSPEKSNLDEVSALKAEIARLHAQKTSTEVANLDHAHDHFRGIPRVALGPNLIGRKEVDTNGYLYPPTNLPSPVSPTFSQGSSIWGRLPNQGISVGFGPSRPVGQPSSPSANVWTSPETRGFSNPWEYTFRSHTPSGQQGASGTNVGTNGAPIRYQPQYHHLALTQGLGRVDTFPSRFGSVGNQSAATIGHTHNTSQIYPQYAGNLGHSVQSGPHSAPPQRESFNETARGVDWSTSHHLGSGHLIASSPDPTSPMRGPFRQMRPIGTPLSPTAAEFRLVEPSSTWNALPHSSSSHPGSYEATNYRLSDPRLSSDWKTMIDKIICNNDQQASIFLQQKVRQGTEEQKHMIIEATIGRCYPLMVNRFGNFLVQRCLEHGTPEQIINITNTIRGHTSILSQDAFACHVVQKAFECAPEDYKTMMIHELLQHVKETVVQRYSCHVWQKLFELRWQGPPPQIMKYVNQSLWGMWQEVALGETGSLVVQNVFENCLEEDKRQAIDEVLHNIDKVARGQFGNWCIQHICEHGSPQDRSAAIDHIVIHAIDYSMDQFASKVVEKCLKNGGNEFLERYLGQVCKGQRDRPRLPLIDSQSILFLHFLTERSNAS